MLARIATLIGAHPADTPADAEAALIVQSGLFDERWYRLTYPDVADFPGGPLAHYLKHGGIEGRAAGPRFDTQAYLIAYPDVAERGVHPLLHYLSDGRREGRSPAPIVYDAESDETEGSLDVFNAEAVATAVGWPLERILWSADNCTPPDEARAGARLVLDLLRNRPDLRTRFPAPLGSGGEGGFAHWVKTVGVAKGGLDAAAAGWVDAAFAARMETPARQILEDEGFRRDKPLFLLPSGAVPTTRRLFKAVYEGRLPLESAWWFLLANAEDAQAALCQTWAITPEWQAAVPDGSTVFGVVRLAEWVAETYRCRDPGIFAQTFPALLNDAAQLRLA